MRLKFHHIGVACKNIKKELNSYIPLGYCIRGGEFKDVLQNIKGIFIEASNQPRLELLENLNQEGPLSGYLKNKNKYYHIAYQVENIEQTIKDLQKEVNVTIISPIKEAVYFKRVCFLILPNMSLIELVELKN